MSKRSFTAALCSKNFELHVDSWCKKCLGPVRKVRVSGSQQGVVFGSPVSKKCLEYRWVVFLFQEGGG